MSRNVVEKILYRRRKFVTRKRIRTVADIISQLLPSVVAKRPSLTAFAGALESALHHADNDAASQTVAVNTGLRFRIKELRDQLQHTPGTADAEKLRQKLDVLYDLLDEETVNSHG